MDKHKTKKFNFKIDEIVLVLIVAVIAILVGYYEKSLNVSSIEAEKITALILDDHQVSFANGGIVDEEKLNKIQGMGYSELKEQLNARKDFCIYMEDDKGNIILAKGSARLSKDGIVCS